MHTIEIAQMVTTITMTRVGEASQKIASQFTITTQKIVRQIFFLLMITTMAHCEETRPMRGFSYQVNEVECVGTLSK